MANSTWNFQVHEARDWPDSPSGRCSTSGGFYTYGTSTTPFTSAFTGIFSIFVKTGWSGDNSGNQLGLFGIGKQGGATGISISYRPTGSAYRVRLASYGATSGSTALIVDVGDEDGSSNMSYDKWYQVAYSINSSGYSYAVNGSSTPYTVVTTEALGNFEIASSTRAGAFGVPVSNPATFLETVNIGRFMPSCMVGPAAYANRYIDLTDSAVLARIYDADGNFRNPGEDGSLWFGDTYGDVQPDYYFASGSPRVQNGTDTAAWYVAATNNATGRIGGPGGLRKQYE